MSKSEKFNIAIDLDETLCDFMTHFLHWYNQAKGTNWQFSDATDYDWSKFLKVTPQAAIESACEFFETDKFKNMPPIDGALKVIQQLSEDYGLYLITARQTTLKGITVNWINTYFPGLFKEIILTNGYPLDGSPELEKGVVCKEKGCLMIVDDNPYHIPSLLENGIQPILLKKPWNKYCTHLCSYTIWVDNLEEALDTIKTLTCS